MDDIINDHLPTLALGRGPDPAGAAIPRRSREDFPSSSILPRKPGFHRNRWTAELSRQGGCAQEGWLKET
jgi:hypothetical protein